MCGELGEPLRVAADGDTDGDAAGDDLDQRGVDRERGLYDVYGGEAVGEGRRRLDGAGKASAVT
jgi:hypothetical protein